MEVTVDKTGACNAKISVTVPAAEFEAEVKKGLQRVGRHVRMKGFRPGKVPPAVIERAHGAEVRRETVQQFLGRAFQQAVEEHELQPAAHPHVHAEDLVPLAGADLQTEFDVALRPEVELEEGYAELEVEGRAIATDDEEIEAAIEDVKRQRSHPETDEEGGLEKDGMVLAKVELLFQDEVVLSRDGLRLGPGTPLPGADPEAYEQAVLGARAGDVVDVEVTFPDDFEHEPARGQKGVGRVTVDQVFRIVAPTDEELFELFDVEDREGLKEKVRERILEAKEDQEQSRVEGFLLEQLIESHPIELPEALIEGQVRDRLDQTREQLRAGGAPEEELENLVAQEEEGVRAGVERSMRALFLIEAIGQKEGLQVTEEDLTAELRSIAQRNKASFEQVREYYAKQNLFQQLGIELLERKVRAFLRESAEITVAGS